MVLLGYIRLTMAKPRKNHLIMEKVYVQWLSCFIENEAIVGKGPKAVYGVTADCIEDLVKVTCKRCLANPDFALEVMRSL